jgi:cytochrome P450
MAGIEAKIILVKLVQKYRFELVEGQSMREYVAITTSLKDGLYVNVLKRS